MVPSPSGSVISLSQLESDVGVIATVGGVAEQQRQILQQQRQILQQQQHNSEQLDVIMNVLRGNEDVEVARKRLNSFKISRGPERAGAASGAGPSVPRSAIGLDNPGASNNGALYLALGKMYFHGDQVDREYVVSARYLREAWHRGNVEACYYLGRQCQHGNGVRSNPEKAVKYFECAADGGVLRAKLYAGRCYLKGIGVTKNESKAFVLFREAANGGISQALHNVAYASPLASEQK